ncbi:MAG: nonstructural protein [Microvirus sp.]|nr:MAG: nonstructural protein [Microvirus sp.]
MKIYTVNDVKAGAYLQPFFMRANAEAQRAFASLVNDPKHQFGIHHSDYTLYQIGEFDEDTGIIKSNTPLSLGNGNDFFLQGDAA